MQVSARLSNWCFLVPKLFFDKKVHTNMSMTFIFRIGLVSVLLTALGCAPAVVTPMPPTVRRIAVLPPYYLGAPDTPAAGTDSDLLRPLQMTVGDVLAQQARMRLLGGGCRGVPPKLCCLV